VLTSEVVAMAATAEAYAAVTWPGGGSEARLRATAWRDGRAASMAENERVAATTVVVGGGNRGGEGRTAVERA
jgi:hypothetical protein